MCLSGVVMNKETFEGLCGIINEMTSIRQKAQEGLVEKSKDYELDNDDRLHLRLQIRTNLDKINSYTRLKVDLRRVYEAYKDKE